MSMCLYGGEGCSHSVVVTEYFIFLFTRLCPMFLPSSTMHRELLQGCVIYVSLFPKSDIALWIWQTLNNDDRRVDLWMLFSEYKCLDSQWWGDSLSENRINDNTSWWVCSFQPLGTSDKCIHLEISVTCAPSLYNLEKSQQTQCPRMWPICSGTGILYSAVVEG